MISVSVLFAVLAIIVAACLLSSRIPNWLRNTFYPVLLLVVVAMWFLSLGHAKPIWAAVDINRQTLIVEAIYLEEPVAIYLVVHPMDSTVPQFLILPWSESEAGKATDMLTLSKANGGQLAIAPEGSPEGEPPTFKIILPVPPPPKVQS